MARIRKFTLIEWWVKDDFKCVIRPYKPQDIKDDGTNFIGAHSQDGYNFAVCECLDDAIKQSRFKLGYITFEHLTEAENSHIEYLKELDSPLIY